MKKQISVLVIVGIVILGFGGVYLLAQRSPVSTGELAASSSLAQVSSTVTVPTSSTPLTTGANPVQGSVEVESSGGEGTITVTPLEEPNLLETDNFSLYLPAGWERTASNLGADAIATVTKETASNPVLRQVDFKTYLAVNHNLLNGKHIGEFMESIKGLLLKTEPNITFANERDMTVNGAAARVTEATYSRTGADFKVLLVMVTGKQDDAWTVSFTTSKEAWDGHRSGFYAIAESFKLK